MAQFDYLFEKMQDKDNKELFAKWVDRYCYKILNERLLYVFTNKSLVLLVNLFLKMKLDLFLNLFTVKEH